jgi:hypothetical protein
MGEYVQCLKSAHVDGDRTQITMAEIKKLQAQDYIKTKGNNNSVYAQVSKFMGFPCREKEMTVKEFYNYLKLMK